jgi:hypothetical protein
VGGRWRAGGCVGVLGETVVLWVRGVNVVRGLGEAVVSVGQLCRWAVVSMGRLDVIGGWGRQLCWRAGLDECGSRV